MNVLLLSGLIAVLGAGADHARAAADPSATVADLAAADTTAPDTAAVDTTAATRPQALRMFVDCQDCIRADLEFFRGDITFVDHVRDRAKAQVHVLITSHSTGGGGDALTLTFIGRESFAALDDTLRYDARPAEAAAVTRAAVSQLLKLGLMRYLARTAAAPSVGITFAVAAGSGGAKPAVVDRWKNWVFRTSINAYLNGQTSYSNSSVYFSQSVNRVTLASKIGLSVNGSYNENRFDIGNGAEIVSISRSRGANARYVMSLAGHWSTAFSVSSRSSTYDNHALLLTAGPALEYNLFPYIESTRRQLRFQYRISYRRADYKAETIFDKSTEDLGREGIEVVLDTREPWGSTQVSVEGDHYLHDFRKNRLQASGSISLNVVQGLSLNISGYAARPRDQLSLAKQAATQEEILLQRRQLATQFEYYVSLGVSYTFGSIYNNIVNARFGSGA